MNLGLSIASHSGLPPARIGDLAGAAEQAGFSAVFVAEGHGDALALCHPVVAATTRVPVGTAVANAALRPPVLAAKTAAQLDQATGGRFILGLGVGNAVMNSRFGLAPFEPLPMVEEYVGVVRSVLNRGTGYDGQLFRTGVIPLDSPPARADLPVWLGALGPRMLALAGRVVGQAAVHHAGDLDRRRIPPRHPRGVADQVGRLARLGRRHQVEDHAVGDPPRQGEHPRPERA